MQTLSHSTSFLKKLEKIIQNIPASTEAEEKILQTVEATVKLLKPQKIQSTKIEAKSKWAKLAEEIDSDPELDKPEIQAALTQLKVDMKEFREKLRKGISTRNLPKKSI